MVLKPAESETGRLYHGVEQGRRGLPQTCSQGHNRLQSSVTAQTVPWVLQSRIELESLKILWQSLAAFNGAGVDLKLISIYQRALLEDDGSSSQLGLACSRMNWLQMRLQKITHIYATRSEGLALL